MQLDLDTYEMANALSPQEALALREAASAAVEAMCHYGSEDKHIHVMTMLRTVGVKWCIENFKDKERKERDNA